MKKLTAVFTAGMALVLGASAVLATAPGSTRADLKRFRHVFVIMMENTGYRSLIGNPNARWINAAAATYGLATHYFGVSHPSQPNYIAATSGSTNGVDGDITVTLKVRNLVDQLEEAGKTWKDYQQSFSLCGGNTLADECGNQLYERKHNPFISYQDVQMNPDRMTNIVDLSRLETDLDSGNVADFSWISPDQCNDMHGRDAPRIDSCSYNNEQLLISAGDLFLKSWVEKIMASKAWTENSVIFITWDESDFPYFDGSGCCDAVPGGGHVMTLVILRSDLKPRRSDTPYNHYSLLATIEDGWRLACLVNTCDHANVPRMTDLVGSGP